MHGSRARCVVLLIVSVMFSAAMLAAQSSGAMVYASGNVKLNGAAVDGPSSVFVGDSLVTSDSSTVSLNRSGSTVVVSPNSSVQYKGSAIDVAEGTAHVSTVNGMSAKAGSVTITPTTPSAKFDVARANGEVVVTSREGAVTINDAGHTSTLQAGSNAKLALSGATSSSGSLVNEPKSKLLASGPFYTIQSPDLPICPTTTYCNRAHVSQLPPCKCVP